jgi:hypothetical protein
MNAAPMIQAGAATIAIAKSTFLGPMWSRSFRRRRAAEAQRGLEDLLGDHGSPPI